MPSYIRSININDSRRLKDGEGMRGKERERYIYMGREKMGEVLPSP